MPAIPPPPTWTDVILYDERTKKSKFNPAWLHWFVSLVDILNDAGGSGGLVHNNLLGLQGGTSGQYYHLTFAQNNIAGTLASGVWTPTLTNVTNLSASTAYQSQYLRVGEVVVFSGRVDVDPTATGACELGISLPLASNFSTANQCGGAGACPEVSGFSVALSSDAANDRISMRWIASDTANRPVYFSGAYRLL